MSWAAVAGATIGVVGGALGSKDQGQQTVKQEIDPRIAQYLYGLNGSGGLLGSVEDLRGQQAQQGGLNGLQTAGLEMQRQALMDPRFTQGYDQMRNLGAGLLSQGVAGNPFSRGLMASGAPSAAPPNYTPATQSVGLGSMFGGAQVSRPSAATMPVQAMPAPVRPQAIPQPVAAPQQQAVAPYDAWRVGYITPP